MYIFNRLPVPTVYIQSLSGIFSSVAEPEPVEPKLIWDLEPGPDTKINSN